MSASTNQRISYRLEISVAVGYAVLFCAMIAACTAFYVLLIMKPSAAPNPGATNPPPLTPSPHVPGDFAATAPQLLDEEFNDDQNGWLDVSGWGGRLASSIDVRDGKLFFASTASGASSYYAVATCKPCSSPNQPYLLTADVATDHATDMGFGVMFHKGDNPGAFYAFIINPESKNYYLLAADNFMLRTSGESDSIRSYPASNTLGLYVDKDSLELYVNQRIVDSYQETGASFQTGAVGFYVDGPGFTLTVDDLRIYKLGVP